GTLLHLIIPFSILKPTSVATQRIILPLSPLPSFSRPPLILVSLDGFRAEYLKDHSSHLPVINKLRNTGTTTPYMRPVYPTKTFPNHYSIVTGLYPESHGIVDNKMYDVTQDAFFSLKTDEKLNPKWYQGEPVWITAMRQKLKTGTFFWPGSDVAINGTHPDYYMVYDKSITFEKRVSKLFEWLKLPQGQRPDFYTLYLDEPDSSGHRYGPASTQVVEALENVDRILGTLMDGLTQRNLQHCVNLIIVSDHGMEEASCEKALYVSSYIDNTADFSVIQGPAARIRPSRLPENFFSCKFPAISSLLCNQPMRPYLKENLPKRMHFANNKRIERGHLYMKSGWQAALNRKELKYCTGGYHGSDNLFTNMQAIFIGYGPGFKESTVVPPFENIEVYNLMCDLLDIRPSPNNGTHGSLNHLLKRPVYLPVHPAQLSHETPCKAVGPVPNDDLQCTCSSLNTTMVCANTVIELMCLYEHLNRIAEGIEVSTDSLLTSNMAPMFPAFKDVWVHVHNVLLPKYSQQMNGVNIMSGPIFDGDYDGNVDALKATIFLKPVISCFFRNEAPIPSHFFIILTSCGNSTFSPVDCEGPLQAKSFILPHRPDHTESCADGSDLTWVEEWLQFHSGRVRDIELLTGLSFYHDRISVEETLQLKTHLQSA
uniref:Ectonucleotide pyrophosphatase/phosphodiesterase 1 n=1 Tax=Sparus aurata TaxID=8175 RepID=A0A671UV46_SPAAU